MLAFGGLFGALLELGVRQGLTFEQTTSILVTVACVFGAISAGILVAFGYHLATKFIAYIVVPILQRIAQAGLAVVKYFVGGLLSVVVGLFALGVVAYFVQLRLRGGVDQVLSSTNLDESVGLNQVLSIVKRAGEAWMK